MLTSTPSKRRITSVVASPQNTIGANLAPDPTLHSLQAELLHNSKYTDLTIICRGRIWRCHRAILCPRCPFFEAACGGHFVESTYQEIELDDDRPDAVEVVLLYLYTLQEPDWTGLQNHKLSTKAGTFLLADKYGVDRLQDYAKSAIVTDIHRKASSWKKKSESSKSIWINFFKRLWTWSQKGSEEIRAAIVQVFVKIGDDVLEDEGLKNMLLETPEISIDYLKMMNSKLKELQRK